MNRGTRSDDVRSAVLKSATQLLLSKGYDGMTIRDVSRRSKVSSGSIYHFFGSKDGVLTSLIQDLFERAASAADQVAGYGADPYLRLAFELASHIRLVSNDSKLADLYRAAYRSWPLTEVVVASGVRRNRALFSSALPDWDEARYFAATTMLKGVLSAVVDERIFLDRLNVQERLKVVLLAALPVFGASQAQTQSILAKALGEGSPRLTPSLRLK